MNRQELSKFVFEKLPLCACGDPEGVVGRMRDILVLLHDKDGKPDFPDRWDRLRAFLKADGDQEDNPDYFLWLYVLNDAELLEHGTSIRCSWITNLGHEFLDAVQDYGTDPEKWKGVIVTP